MAKKSGLFSWFKKDQNKAQSPETSDSNEPQVEVSNESFDSVLEQEIQTQSEDSASETLSSDVTSASEVNTQELTDENEQVIEETATLDEAPAGEQVEPTPSVSVNEKEETLVDEPSLEEEATNPEEASIPEESGSQQEVKTDNEPEQKKAGFFERLKKGLSRTRQNIGGGFLSLFKGKEIDDDLYEELETHLLMADVGMDTTVKLIDRLTEHADRKSLKDADALYGLLKNEMSEILKKSDKPLTIEAKDGPFVILMVGVNGVGKTTTIGKMAKQFQNDGKSVMLAAGDTFRAAAVEQLQVWGDRNDVPVIAQHTGADSASVIFDAYQAAKARGADVLIADTAGRLQNKENLMQELEKIVRVLKKFDDSIPHEIMLTIDATTGQNAISQTKLFDEAVGLTGISLTKLDGTAKGGVIFAVAEQFGIPIRYIGVGEGIEDLRTFEHQDFIDALFTE